MNDSLWNRFKRLLTPKCDICKIEPAMYEAFLTIDRFAYCLKCRDAEVKRILK